MDNFQGVYSLQAIAFKSKFHVIGSCVGSFSRGQQKCRSVTLIFPLDLSLIFEGIELQWCVCVYVYRHTIVQHEHILE